MDILCKTYDADTERVRVYHNIDPNSLVICGRCLYFAHPDCWVSDNCANRYRIMIGGMDYFTTDPAEIERALQLTPGLERGLLVSRRDRHLSEALCEAVGGPSQPVGGDAE